MDQAEQVQADSRNQGPTEAEKVLGSMPEYSGYNRERVSDSHDSKKEKLSFEEREGRWISGLSDIKLLEAEEENRRKIDEILGGTMFGVMDRWNLPMYQGRNDLIKEEIR